QVEQFIQFLVVETFHRRSIDFELGGGGNRHSKTDVSLTRGMFKIYLRRTVKVNAEQSLLVIIKSIGRKPALLGGVRKYVRDALFCVIIPRGKHEQVRTVGDLRLVKRYSADLLL